MKKKLDPVVKQRIQLYGGILLMLVLCVGFVRLYRMISTSKYGQILDGTGETIQSAETVHVEYLDTDAFEVPMGESAYQIRKYGSLLSCTAAALRRNGQDTDVLSLNRLLSERGIYTDGAQVDWKKMEKDESFAVSRVRAPVSFTSREIAGYLRSGLLPIVKVHAGEEERWIVITGEDLLHGFTVLDPMSPEQTLYLKEYGRVYALRVLENL
ncbi:MAG: hypothetical protein II781_04435 [Clostridia bacterium]|nr:hypothetical protein [Clostridia bacterium]